MLKFILDNKEVIILLAIYILSGLLNWALAFKTPEEWEKFIKKNPKGAIFIKMLRKFGLDLPGLIRLLQKWLEIRAGKKQTLRD